MQIFDLDPLNHLVRNEFPSSLFGFQNRTSEFIGISVIVQLNYLSTKNKTKYTIFPIALLSLCISYLILLYTRSVLLGIILSSPIILIPSFKHTKKQYIIVVLLSAVLSTVLINHVEIYDYCLKMMGKEVPIRVDPFKRYNAKTDNAKLRLIRWINTSYMILKNPLGVGLGNYEFGYVPYDSQFQKDFETNENKIPKSPHNGYLELASETGIISLILLLIIILIIFKRLARNYLQQKKGDIAVLLALVIFFLNQAFWAFPLEVPFTFAFIAILSGTVFRKISLANEMIVINKLFIMPLCFLILVLGSLYSISHFIDYNLRNDYKYAKLACNLFPSNWRICVQKGYLESATNKFNQSNKTYNKLLKHMPYNFVALLHQGINHSKQGNHYKACLYYRLYDLLFNSKSRTHNHVKDFCQHFQ